MTRDEFYTICPVCGAEHYGFGAHFECRPYLEPDDEPDDEPAPTRPVPDDDDPMPF